ncbi:MAG TPA: hypothetical protein VK067_00230 [Pseudogracilibacillus sp.]|nr:hypothetical protein [Pseudogracilibacillus sp.]
MEIVAASLYETLVPFLLYLFLVIITATVIVALLPIPKVLKRFIGIIMILSATYWLINEFLLKGTQI